jgi:hypothetical protein
MKVGIDASVPIHCCGVGKFCAVDSGQASSDYSNGKDFPGGLVGKGEPPPREFEWPVGCNSNPGKVWERSKYCLLLADTNIPATWM